MNGRSPKQLSPCWPPASRNRSESLCLAPDRHHTNAPVLVGSLNTVLADRHEVVEMCHIFDVKTGSSPDTVIKAAADGLARNSNSVVQNRPLEMGAQIPAQPARFELANMADAFKGTGMGAMLSMAGGAHLRSQLVRAACISGANRKVRCWPRLCENSTTQRSRGSLTPSSSRDGALQRDLRGLFSRLTFLGGKNSRFHTASAASCHSDATSMHGSRTQAEAPFRMPVPLIFGFP